MKPWKLEPVLGEVPLYPIVAQAMKEWRAGNRSALGWTPTQAQYVAVKEIEAIKALQLAEAVHARAVVAGEAWPILVREERGGGSNVPRQARRLADAATADAATAIWVGSPTARARSTLSPPSPPLPSARPAPRQQPAAQDRPTSMGLGDRRHRGGQRGRGRGQEGQQHLEPAGGRHLGGALFGSGQ